MRPVPPPRSDRDTAFIDNVARHLRLHPQAQEHDDLGRVRPLTRREAEEIAKVALRAAAAWLVPAALDEVHPTMTVLPDAA